MAGHMKVKWKTFFFYNSLAVLIFVPAFVLIGYHSTKLLDIIIMNINNIRHIIFFIILAIIGLCVYYFIDRRFLVKKTNRN
jgi:membrane protein DedA with SNARE-associated domain